MTADTAVWIHLGGDVEFVVVHLADADALGLVPRDNHLDHIAKVNAYFAIRYCARGERRKRRDGECVACTAEPLGSNRVGVLN